MRAAMAALELAGLGLVAIGSALYDLRLGLVVLGLGLIYVSRGDA